MMGVVKRRFATLLLTIASLLFLEASSAHAVGSLPEYSLTVRFEERQGIRLTPYSTYTYWETKDGVRRQLWTETLREAYHDHWISPTGVLWVQTVGPKGGPGFVGVWARDTVGRVRLRLDMGYLIPRGDPRWQLTGVVAPSKLASSPGLEQAAFTFDEARSTTVQSVECEDGSYITIVFGDLGASRPPDRLIELMRSNGPSARPTWTVGSQNIIIWQIAGEERVVVHKGRMDSVREPYILRVESEETLAQMPSRIVRCGSNFLWFSKGYREVAFMGWQGQQLARFDLGDLAGLRDQVALPLRLRFDELILRTSEHWFKPDEVLGGLKVLEISLPDEAGNRFVFRVDNTRGDVEATFLRGLAARMPKELLPLELEIVDERFVESPNKKFRLRIRTLDRNPELWQSRTLLMRTSDDCNGDLEVEVGTGYGAASGYFVSDSGNVVLLMISEFRQIETASLVLRRPEGGVGSGSRLVKEGLFANVQAVRELLDMNRVTVVYGGSEGRQEVDGLQMSVRGLEEYTFRLRDGSALVHTVLRGQGFVGARVKRRTSVLE